MNPLQWNIKPAWSVLPPLCLYIHVPWCVRKCPYCDFNSHGVGDDLDGIPEDRYIEALLDDLDEDLQWVQGRALQSIFIGGGTPSLLSAKSYKRLLHGIRLRVPLAADCEITLEANPGTFEQQKFSAFREVGINRLSIGIQSFNASHLTVLGRIHSAQQGIQAATIAKQVGFDNFNLDLMHGLSRQSVEQALADIEQAIALSPTHLSWYQLTLEPNTEFYSKPPLLPDDELLWEIQEQGQALIAASGYQQYEISAYAQPNKRARHNLNYWTFGDYIGIGAGAHGKLTLLDQQRAIRTQKTRVPRHYLDVERPYRCNLDPIIDTELPFDFLMNALRLIQGSPTPCLAYAGLHLQDILVFADAAIQKGWLVADEERIYATPLGQRFLNSLLAELLG